MTCLGKRMPVHLLPLHAESKTTTMTPKSASQTTLRASVWSGSIPIEFRLSASECRVYDQADPYLVNYTLWALLEKLFIDTFPDSIPSAFLSFLPAAAPPCLLQFLAYRPRSDTLRRLVLLRGSSIEMAVSTGPSLRSLLRSRTLTRLRY